MSVAGSGHRVLVGVDGSTANRPALLWAAAEAQARPTSLVAAYAWHIPPFVYYSPGYAPVAADELEEDGRKLVETAIGSLPTEYQVRESLEVEYRSVEGPPHRALDHLAAEAGIDLVVVGKRGHGAVAGLLLGSTSHALSHHCPKPLVIVPSNGETKESPDLVGHLVVGVDGSDGSDTALRWAAAEAEVHNAVLEVAVAWSWVTMPPEMVVGMPIDVNLEVAAKEIVSKAIDRLDPKGLEIRVTVREGSAADVLLGLASSADLLVVGTRGLGRAREMFLGSTSHQCAHRSSVPVAIIPTDHKE